MSSPKPPTVPSAGNGCVPVIGVTQPCQVPAVPPPSVLPVIPPPPGSWTVQCVLDIFCKGDAQDRDIVSKLPRLTVNNREPKQVHYKKYHGGTWIDDGFTSGGSAQGTTIAVNNDTNCADAASTFVHEVRHTDQPDTMPESQKEYDAYYQTELWRIKKGLPAWEQGFRKLVSDPNDPSQMIEVPDKDAIKASVDKDYAYNPPTPASGGIPPPRVLGVTPDGSMARLSDGTTRPPREGDAYRLPDTGGRVVEQIDSSKWKCP